MVKKLAIVQFNQISILSFLRQVCSEENLKLDDRDPTLFHPLHIWEFFVLSTCTAVPWGPLTPRPPWRERREEP